MEAARNALDAIHRAATAQMHSAATVATAKYQIGGNVVSSPLSPTSSSPVMARATPHTTIATPRMAHGTYVDSLRPRNASRLHRERQSTGRLWTGCP